MRRKYIHQQPDWPALRWRPDVSVELLADVRRRQGLLVGRMEALGFDLRREASLRSLTDEVVKSSDMEGETLDAEQVRSSIAPPSAPRTPRCGTSRTCSTAASWSAVRAAGGARATVSRACQATEPTML